MRAHSCFWFVLRLLIRGIIYILEAAMEYLGIGHTINLGSR